MRRLLTLLILLFGVYAFVCAQYVYYPAGSLGEYETMRARLVAHRNIDSFFSNSLYKRVFHLSDPAKAFPSDIGKENYGWLYLQVDNLEIARASKRQNPLYKHQAAFYSQKKADYLFVINSVLNTVGGKESLSGNTLYQNTRGAEMWGNIGGPERGVGFYTYFTDNQALLPTPYRYFHDSLNFVPNEFFYKKFKNGQAVDYFQARGYVTFNAVK